MKRILLILLFSILLLSNVYAGWNTLSHTITSQGQTLISSEDEDAQKLLQAVGIMSSAFSRDYLSAFVFLLAQTDKENSQKYQTFGQLLSAFNTPEQTEQTRPETTNAILDISGNAVDNPNNPKCEAKIMINLEDSDKNWSSTDINSLDLALSDESKYQLSSIIGESFVLPKTDGQVIIAEMSNCGPFSTVTNMEVVSITEETDKYILTMVPNTDNKAGLNTFSQVVVNINDESYIFNRMNPGSFLTFHMLKQREKVTGTLLNEAKIFVSSVREYKFPGADTELLAPKGTIIEYKDGKARYFLPKVIEKDPAYYVLANNQIIPVKLIPNSRLSIEGNKVSGTFGFSSAEKEFTVQYGTIEFSNINEFSLQPDSFLIEEDGTTTKTFSKGIVSFKAIGNTIVREYNDLDEIEIKGPVASINKISNKKYCKEGYSSLFELDSSEEVITGAATSSSPSELNCPLHAEQYNQDDTKRKIIIYTNKDDITTNSDGKQVYDYYWFPAGDCYYYGLRVAAGISENQAAQGSSIANKIWKIVDNCNGIVNKYSAKVNEKYTHPSYGTLTKLTQEGGSHLYSMFNNPSYYFEKSYGPDYFDELKFEVEFKEFEKQQTEFIQESYSNAIVVQECCVRYNGVKYFLNDNYGYTCRDAARGVPKGCSKGTGKSWTSKTQGGETIQNSNTGKREIAPQNQGVVCCIDYNKFYRN